MRCRTLATGARARALFHNTHTQTSHLCAWHLWHTHTHIHTRARACALSLSLLFSRSHTHTHTHTNTHTTHAHSRHLGA